MKREVEIRCGEDVYAKIVGLPEYQGKWLRHDYELTKVIRGLLDDPKFAAFCDRLKQAPWYHGFADILYRYSASELESAELLYFYIWMVCEPSGEECGTSYDESKACPRCKSGRVRTSPLRLNVSKIPLRMDFAVSIARDEWAISDRVVRILRANNITGVNFKPVEHCGNPLKNPRRYQELVVDSVVEMANENEYGIDYFNRDVTRYVCSFGHTKGLNHLSEVYIKRSSWHGYDMAKSDVYVGNRCGVLAPTSLLFISQRLFRLLKDHGVKGYGVRVAHLLP